MIDARKDIGLFESLWLIAVAVVPVLMISALLGWYKRPDLESLSILGSYVMWKMLCRAARTRRFGPSPGANGFGRAITAMAFPLVWLLYGLAAVLVIMFFIGAYVLGHGYAPSP